MPNPIILQQLRNQAQEAIQFGNLVKFDPRDLEYILELAHQGLWAKDHALPKLKKIAEEPGSPCAILALEALATCP